MKREEEERRTAASKHAESDFSGNCEGDKCKLATKAGKECDLEECSVVGNLKNVVGKSQSSKRSRSPH